MSRASSATSFDSSGPSPNGLRKNVTERQGTHDVHAALTRFKSFVVRLSVLAILAAIWIAADSVKDVGSDEQFDDPDPCKGENEPGCIEYNYGRGIQYLLQLVGMVVLIHYSWAPIEMCGNTSEAKNELSEIASGGTGSNV